jgi:hypothetical protein
MRAVFWGIVAAMLSVTPMTADCFVGQPGKVTYNDGRVITIIQRHGDDLTYTEPYEGYQDAVSKTHMMLFPKTSRRGARATEIRWSSPLPKLKQMVPGYHFDLQGTMKSGDGTPLPYRSEGDVLGKEVVKVGKCTYDVLVIKTATYLDNQVISVATDYLSIDLLVVMRSDINVISSGRQVKRTVVAIQ